MSNSKEVGDLISFLRSRRAGGSTPAVSNETGKVKRVRESRGVRPAVTKLYLKSRDTQIVALVNEIMERSMTAKATGECRSADKYAARLADKAILPVLRARGVKIPRGYKFEKYVADWINLRSYLASLGHTRLRIFVPGYAVTEMAKERAGGIIRDVERELKLRVA